MSDEPLLYNLMKSLNIFCALRKGEVFRGAVFETWQTSFPLTGEVFRERLSVLLDECRVVRIECRIGDDVGQQGPISVTRLVSLLSDRKQNVEQLAGKERDLAALGLDSDRLNGLA